ncbi:MAG: HNH endonuclease [Leptolyngbya sp.]|nr:MAG: HNH endonuclease [Leptolyngbya sp.]
MNPKYALVAARAGHRCEYCCAPELVFNCQFEVEHIIPLAKGGSNQDDNLALACRSCNLRKGTSTTGVDAPTGNTVPIFNPRQANWSEHFQISETTGAIVGLTSMGRVTVERLELNSSLQLTARKVWIQLGLFP